MGHKIDIASVLASYRGAPSPPHLPSQFFPRLVFLASVLKNAPRSRHGSRLLWRVHGTAISELYLDRSCTIGRGPDNEVVLDSPRVSRRHCVVHHSSRSDEIEDCHSANGTWVNGEQIMRRALRDGDVIELGGHFFAYDNPQAKD